MNGSIRLLARSALVALSFAPVVVAQTSFTEVTPTGGSLWVTSAEEDFWINAVAPADVDGDGDVDLAILGFHVVYFGEVTDVLAIFRNQGPDAGDTTSCAGAAGYHVVQGVKSQLPMGSGGAYSLGGSACSVASPWTWSDSPDPSADFGKLLWFLVIANDGSSTEGSWGTDDQGIERTGPEAGSASGVCRVSTKSLANSCGH